MNVMISNSELSGRPSRNTDQEYEVSLNCKSGKTNTQKFPAEIGLGKLNIPFPPLEFIYGGFLPQVRCCT